MKPIETNVCVIIIIILIVAFNNAIIDFDKEIVREMGQLGILGPTIEGMIINLWLWIVINYI